MLYNNNGGKHRIQGGTERITVIVDIFNIIQEVPDTGFHLKVDEEQWRVAQESKRQVGGEPSKTTFQGCYCTSSYPPHTQSSSHEFDSCENQDFYSGFCSGKCENASK